MTSSALASAYPPFGLTIRAGSLTLRPVTDDVLPQLVRLAADGIHDRATMPFYYPWTDAPPDRLPAEFVQYHWGIRARWSRAAWSLEFAVEHDGEIVGVQGVSTQDYLVTRSGETGSWLGQRYQGHGIGTKMRQTICAFLFDDVDAAEIRSGAFTDNPASLAVSRKLGFRPDGTQRMARRGALAEVQRLVLSPDAFVRGEPIEVAGIDAFRTFIGLDG